MQAPARGARRREKTGLASKVWHRETSELACRPLRGERGGGIKKIGISLVKLITGHPPIIQPCLVSSPTYKGSRDERKDKALEAIASRTLVMVALRKEPERIRGIPGVLPSMAYTGRALRGWR